jgi:hypothetical protein
MMDEQQGTPAHSLAPTEVNVLARKMAAAYATMAEFYRKQMGLSPAEADARASEPADAAYRNRLLTESPDQTSWWRLSSLMEAEPETAMALWERVKECAREELENGHRAAESFDWNSGPWERAQFLALRVSFQSEWKPQGGIESALIDTMAQTLTAYMYWMERLHIQADSDSKVQDHDLKEKGYWLPPRIVAADAMEMSAAMADRFHRMFLRTLRSLRDLRRYSPDVFVQHAEQVNVGEQQVNIAEKQANIAESI